MALLGERAVLPRCKTSSSTLHSVHALTEITDGIGSLTLQAGSHRLNRRLNAGDNWSRAIVMWLLGFIAFHVTSGVIHILLLLAVVSVIAHFFRGRAAV
jgi:hypothetical protein